MLGKLMKYELKETSKLLIPLHIILIGMTLIGAILLGCRIFQNSALSLLSASCVLIYALSILALFIITAVYLTIRFYKTMYASQGYLTHTLPVSEVSILNTKIFVFVLWICISCLISVLSVFFLIRIAAGESLDVSSFKYAFPAIFGMNPGEFWIWFAIGVVLSFSCIVLQVTASLAVGQLFQKYRIPAAIGAYVVFYLIEQIVNTVGLLIWGLQEFNAFSKADAASMAAIVYGDSPFRGIILLTIVSSLFFCIAYYIICNFITRKKLNLE